MSSPALCEKRFVRMVARTAIHYTSASARRLGFWTTSEKIGTPCRVAWQKCFGNRCKDTLLWKALPPCPKNCGSMQLRCRRFATIFRRNVLGPRLHTVERRYNKTCGQLHSLQKPMAFGGCPLPQLTNTAVPWYNETPKQVWIFLEHCLHFSPRIRQGVRRFLLRGTTDEHILPTHRVRRTDRHGSQLLAE